MVTTGGTGTRLVAARGWFGNFGWLARSLVGGWLVIVELLKVAVSKLQPTALRGGLCIKYIQKLRPIPFSKICKVYAWKHNDQIAEVSSDSSVLQNRQLTNTMTFPNFQLELVCSPVSTHNTQ